MSTKLPNHIIFKPVDYLNEGSKIIEHLRQFYYKGSPLHKYLGWDDAYAAEWDHAIINRYLPQNLSIVAIDLETNEIAGVRISIGGTQIQELMYSDPKNHKISQHLEKTRKMDKLLLHRAFKNGEFKDGRGVDERECIGIVACVSPKYRNCGIATELYIQSHNLLKGQGFTIIKPFISSPITRKITLGLGYKELSRVYFDEMIGSDGLPDFKLAEHGTFVSYMSKAL